MKAQYKIHKRVRERSRVLTEITRQLRAFLQEHSSTKLAPGRELFQVIEFSAAAM